MALGYQSEIFEGAFMNYEQIDVAHFADWAPIWITFDEP
jgi:hypothetical protein